MATTTETVTATQHFPESKLDEQALTGNFLWKDLLIPENVGKGSIKRFRMQRTLITWAGVSALGLYSFCTSTSPSLRAAGLGLVFPGAGLVAVATIPAAIAFVLSTVSIPLVLFAWFGAGGLFFPIALWTGTVALAAILAQETLFELSAPITVAVCVVAASYIAWQNDAANNEARAKRQMRNEYLVDAVRQNQTAAKKPDYGSRELDLRNLRFLQWLIELGLKPFDDFSYHDVIDQFQTSAIRYQLYETVSDLGLYQFVYVPNFHGYVSRAMRNCIEKSLTERVVGFWKYESAWGKFKFQDLDPIREDDIMVSGYVLQAVGIYQSNTGDTRYTRPGSLTFEVSKKHKYPYDLKTIADAVNRNWEQGPYCLFSCEPNWIYTPCNLTGISGITLAGRLLNVKWAERLKTRFAKALDEEFTQGDGTIMTIRSELTGFTIPGLAGRLCDGVNALLCAAFLPNVAHRCWAFVRKEAIKKKEDGSIELCNLIGADSLDPGNYKPGEGATRAIFAASAAEYGDVEVRDQLLKEIDEVYHPVFTTKTGSLKNKGLSTLEQGTAMKGRLGAYQDWFKMVTEGPPENVFKGPVLDEVPFPDVLVSKAYSPDGETLDLVLYPGKEAGRFDLGFYRLAPGATYTLGSSSAVADKEGKATFTADIDGRTALKLAIEQHPA